MSSDRIGKYREKSSRSRTPYARPKGLIRRVTDSVSGLLGNSWIPGFLRAGDDDDVVEDDNDVNHHTTTPVTSPQQQSAAYSRAQKTPSTTRNSDPALYAEEDVSHNLEAIGISRIFPESSFREASSSGVAGGLLPSQSNVVNFGAGSSNSNQQSSNNSSLLASTPQLTAAARSSATTTSSSSRGGGTDQYTNTPQAYQHYATPRPLPTSADHHHNHHQHYVAATASPRANMTPVRPASVAATPSGGLTPLTPSARLASAQPSSSKRPRFSLAAYSAVATPAGNKSVLSDGSFRSSPFYPGRTIYGGAAAYRRTPTPVTPRSATASPRVGSDGGLSEAAQRILTCLNSMSTPLTDAKRIPTTPTASPYSSYLDSPYTAAFHKHRPSRLPPSSPLNTPAKVGLQSNMSQYVLPARSSSTSSGSQQQQVVLPSKSGSASGGGKCGDSFLDPAASASGTTGPQQPSIFSVAAASASSSSSLRSPAAPPPPPAATTGKQSSSSSSVLSSFGGATSSIPTGSSSSSSSGGSNPLLQPSKPLKLSTSRLPAIVENMPGAEDASPARDSAPMFSFASNLPSSSSIGSCAGKIKSIKQNNTRGSQFKEPEFIVPPVLPKATLPKITFNAPICLSGNQSSKVTSSIEPKTFGGVPVRSQSSFAVKEKAVADTFQFSVPEVLEKRAGCQPVQNQSSLFSFSAPSSVLSCDSGSIENFAPSKSSFHPKMKGFSPKKSVVNKGLNSEPGDLLNFLNKTSENGAYNSSTVSKLSGNSFSSDVNNCKSNEKISVQSGWGDKFKTPTGSWVCDTCMVRNTADLKKCVACDTVKPGQSAAASPPSAASSKTLAAASTAGFGDMFKKSSSEWDCDTCMLRNKSTTDECIACKTAKLGVTKSATVPNNKFEKDSGGFKFGVDTTKSNDLLPSASTNSSGFKFGLSTSTTQKDFSFGINSSPVSSTATSINSIPTLSAFSSKSTVDSSTKTSSAPSSSGFGAAFKKTAGDWECSTCLVNNKSSTNKCVACETAKPGPPSVPVTAVTKPTVDAPLIITQGFGDKFKKAVGDWECEVCLVGNKAAVSKCISCESLKPGSLNTSKALTGNFKFGSTDKTDSGFKFGVAATSAPKFVDSNNIVSNASKFSFGCVKTSDASSNQINSISSNKTSTENGKADFSFGSATAKSTNGGVNFVPSFCSNSADKTQSFSFSSSTNASPVLKTKTPTVQAQPPKLETKGLTDFLKNTSNDTSTKSSDKKDAPTFSFGSSKSDAPAADSLFKFNNSASQSTPAFSFGSSNKLSTGDKVPGMFGNAGVLRKDTDNSLLNEQGNKKRSHSPVSQNNGVVEPAQKSIFNNTSAPAQKSLFSFGQPASDIKSASSVFGGSNSAFSNTNFTNNNNNTITEKSKQGAVPNATAPVFAFGQSTEKKPNATFEFGTAAPPSFNFATAAATTPTFAFQSPQLNNTSNAAPVATNNGLFQFGNSAPAGPATPTFGGAPGNLFGQTAAAAPQGRVIKRAIRRTKK